VEQVSEFAGRGPVPAEECGRRQGGLFKGLFGGGGVDWGGWMSNSSSWTLPSDLSMSFFHEGGRVGGGGRRSAMTVADYLGFLNAPRFHNGTRGR
jgi:hypothetical protein